MGNIKIRRIFVVKIRLGNEVQTVYKKIEKIQNQLQFL